MSLYLFQKMNVNWSYKLHHMSVDISGKALTFFVRFTPRAMTQYISNCGRFFYVFYEFIKIINGCLEIIQYCFSIHICQRAKRFE